ncbi:MAG: NifB/NifX family molybdenum-iron cluster-binding protein [Anaerolineaceae bacterium]|nr:NifB/NifX family molybdenum-iron cluster-binding protein [Anaerolineaceae bacterium]
MKIAFSTQSDTSDAAADPKFGRAKWFCLFDTENQEKEFIANDAGSAKRGAGVQAGQLMAEKEVKAVVSGHFGPNAFEVLTAANIEMFLLPENYSVNLEEAIQLFQNNELRKQ